MHKPVLKLALLAGVALFAAASLGAADRLRNWSPMDDAYGSVRRAQRRRSKRSVKKRGRGGTSAKGRALRSRPISRRSRWCLPILKNGGDVLTYSTVAAGVDASIATRRAEAQVSLRYERLIGYDNGVEDQDIPSPAWRAVRSR